MMEQEGFNIQPELEWSLRKRIYRGDPPSLAARNVYEWWMGMRNSAMETDPLRPTPEDLVFERQVLEALKDLACNVPQDEGDWIRDSSVR